MILSRDRISLYILHLTLVTGLLMIQIIFVFGLKNLISLLLVEK